MNLLLQQKIFQALQKHYNFIDKSQPRSQCAFASNVFTTIGKELNINPRKVAFRSLIKTTLENNKLIERIYSTGMFIYRGLSPKDRTLDDITYNKLRNRQKLYMRVRRQKFKNLK